MKKYPKYKDSGNKWLGQIPEHWKVGKIKLLCDSIFAGATPSTGKQEYWEGGSIPWIPSGCCHDCKIKEAPKFITEAGLQNSSTKMIPANTTVMALTGATCAQLGYLTFEACSNQSVVAFVENKKKADSRFLYYSLYAAREEILTHKSGGAQGGINQEDCRNTQIVIIPLSEQQAIANFLDKKTGEIDQAIALLETQKTDLQAYRQALITETVTKGLNPNAPMKDSGIQWIGEIPETWKVDKLKLLFILHRGYDLANSNFVDGGVPVYGSGGFMGYHNEIKVLAPNIVIGRSGSVGKLHYITEDFWAHNTGIYISDTKENNVKYLYYILSSFDVSALATKTAVPTLDRKKIQEKVFPYTTNIIEQQAIVEYLDKKTSDIDTAIQKINTQIADLQAYRTALISEAVTGKIDVR